jgi:outer membrane receptor for ferrienterochelin and colicin
MWLQVWGKNVNIMLHLYSLNHLLAHRKLTNMLRKILQLLLVLMLPAFAIAQTTTSSMSGVIKTATGEPLIGATVTAIHEPTGTVYKTQTRSGGRFDMTNMNPGGPYTVEVSFVNFTTDKRTDVYLNLGETYKLDAALKDKANELAGVEVSSARAGTSGKGGTQVSISSEKLATLPTVGRNITDYLRAVPQARIMHGTEGTISIAGQNNRYNAFYIDGALNNDVFGLAASGTNGGQANIPPISLDAIEQIQVAISPYDASLSGFTGGGINAITKSGTNQVRGTAYYLFRNESLSGKTPTGLKANATKLPDFNDRTYGLSIGGPIIKNKLFFFVNGEIVRFERPQTFDTSKYSGNTKGAALLALRDTLLKRYAYEPGGFIDNPEKVNADRINAKIDWNINTNNKFTFTYRYNKGERFNTTSSSSSTINFYNDGYIFPTKTSTYIGELRSVLSKNMSNRLLVNFANVNDDRGPLGSPFPRVSITDGSGRIIFGPDNSSTINLLTQKNYNLLDAVRLNLGKHVLTLGTDDELNDDYNAFIQNTWGNYTYNNLTDFYNNAKPSAYSVGYPLVDNKQDETTAAAAKFKTARVAFFLNDEYKPNENLTLNFALRADKFWFVTTPATDSFTNNVAIPKFSQYYDMEGARSGLKPKIPVSLSPRIGFVYRIPEENVTVRGGIGYFTGRVPLVWPAGIYNNNGIYQGSFTANSSQNAAALNTIRFRSDPYNQWRASDVGIALSKGGLNLISAKFKLPKILRTTLAVDKRFGKGWTATVEGIFSKNVNEIYYTNINILPPVGRSTGPGSRVVYPLSVTIPLVGANNPYDNAILLTNNHNDNKGFSYNFTFSLDKRFQRGFGFNMNYSYGESVVVHEQTSSVNLSQWRFIETVDGRNNIGRSFSDFSPGHRVFATVSKKFTYAKKMLATTVSLVYTGQSGAPFSYVYSQGSGANPGPTRDDPSGGNDLIYIPTSGDIQTYLNNAQFVNNTVSGVVYTPAQQAAALETYIQNNRYLSKHRGQFADRNGDRLPFTHILDLRIAQDFNVKVGAKRIQFQVTYDIFNFTNFLNRDWGRTYFLGNDNITMMIFNGYKNATTDLTPVYRFNPTLAQPQSIANVSTTTIPSLSPRWSSQLGFRINF